MTDEEAHARIKQARSMDEFIVWIKGEEECWLHLIRTSDGQLWKPKSDLEIVEFLVTKKMKS